MAHFAKLDDNNVVIDVNVVDNAMLNNLEFPESEPIGIEYLTWWSGGHSNWRQTSYNNKFRKRYAGIGWIYDANRDAFIYPKPFDSWIMNEETCMWEAPIPYPDDGNNYAWIDEQWEYISL